VLAFQPEGSIVAINARYGTTHLVAEACVYPWVGTLPPDQRAWLDANRAVIVANLAPDMIAVNTVRKAVKAGYGITVCTERDPSLTDVTRAWLAYWQIPGAGQAAVVGPGGKEALLERHGAGDPAVLIDDSPHNEALARPGVSVWVPPRPWTPAGDPSPGVWRFTEWRDVRKKLGLQARLNS
jgi:hypothetical protein